MGGRSRIKYPYSCWGEFLLSLGHTLDKQIFWFLMFMTFQLFFYVEVNGVLTTSVSVFEHKCSVVPCVLM